MSNPDLTLAHMIRDYVEHNLDLRQRLDIAVRALNKIARGGKSLNDLDDTTIAEDALTDMQNVGT